MRPVAPVCIALCCAIAGAHADGRKPSAREEVVVTASRTPIALRNAGASVTVITREDIERRNPAFLADLLRDVPGFALGRFGGAGKVTQLRVRGAEANQVLVLIDGI